MFLLQILLIKCKGSFLSQYRQKQYSNRKNTIVVYRVFLILPSAVRIRCAGTERSCIKRKLAPYLDAVHISDNDA